MLPSQASSVACERVFSASKQIATDRRARLGAKRFEELQMLKFAWRNKITDKAFRNSEQIEEIEGIGQFTELCSLDARLKEWDLEDEEYTFFDAD